MHDEPWDRLVAYGLADPDVGIEVAAASDPELACLLDTIKAARREEMSAAARALAGPGKPRPEREETAATLYVLYGPDVADMLMGDYGWSPARYERWLADMIYETVLRG